MNKDVCVTCGSILTCTESNCITKSKSKTVLTWSDLRNKHDRYE